MYFNNSHFSQFFDDKSIVSFWTYVSTETEKELLTEELKSSREAVKQFSQEMNELRGRSEKEIFTSFFKRVFWLIYEVKSKIVYL